MRNRQAGAWWVALVFLVACGSGGRKSAPDGGVSQQCAPTTCAAQGKTCGAVPDGCGGTLDCGSCPAGAACSAANVCGTASSCVPASCQTQGRNCGAVPDGCGGMVACGTCPNGQVCGGSNTCSTPPPTCAPTTCGALGKNCGNLPDGCGGTLACGTCGGSETCGGAGNANVCGTPPVKGGDTRWVEFVDSGADDAVQRVAADKDGNALAAGVSGQATSSPSLFLRKYGGDGKLAWEKRWSFDSPSFVTFTGLATSPALGNIFLAVQIYCGLAPCKGPDLGGGAIGAPVLVKLDPAGAFNWQLPAGDIVGQVSVDANGSAALAGYSYKDGAGFVTKYDFTGKQLWSFRTGFTSPLAFDAAGNLAVFSHRDPSGNYVATLLRLDPDGKVLWTKRIDGYSEELGTTTIGTIISREFDHLAVYEAVDGAQRFRTPLPMYTTGLGVDPAGRAAVAGSDSGGCNDLAVRYYTLDGVFQWSRMVGATGSCGGAPRPLSAAIRAGGDVVVGGEVTAPADLGKGLYSPKSADGFVLDLAP